MSSNTTSQNETEEISKRRTAINQLGGPKEAQLYYDTHCEEPVILTQNEGWGTIGSRDYMDRTWRVQRPRGWIASSGLELEIIKQSTKLSRCESDRYQTLADETVDQILETATEKNREWMAVEHPHIPYDGEGGINIYVDGERLRHKAVESSNQVFLKDDWPDYEIGVRVNYGTDEKFVEAEIDGKTIPYSRVSNAESITEDIVYEPDTDHDAPTVVMRLNTECEQHGETEYQIPEAMTNNATQ